MAARNAAPVATVAENAVAAATAVENGAMAAEEFIVAPAAVSTGSTAVAG